MKRYIENMHQREPHERRAHALRVASAITAVVFVGWLATLGIRLATYSNEGDSDFSQTAAVLQGFSPIPNTLETSPEPYSGN